MFEKLLSLDLERQHAIINAALKEFANKGFRDASTNVIAKNSGISKPLMFHYINNKKDFFFFLFDYCLDILNLEYFNKINLKEKDIFERLRQACLLKIKVMQKYPWIFDFIKIVVLNDAEEINAELKDRRKKVETNLFERFYDDIDQSKFRDELNVDKAKQLIYWAVGGYAGEILDQLQSDNTENFNFEKIRIEFDSYIDELKKTYYR